VPSLRDDGLVLARYPYRERDLVVSLLLRESGLLRVVARRARGGRSPLASVLEPLALVSVTCFVRPSSELGTLDEAAVLRTSFPLAAKPAAWAAGQAVAELALTFCHPGQEGETSFRLVDHCVVALLAGADPRAVAHYAELWFLKLAGVLPELGRCGVCAGALDAGRWAFDVSHSHFVCAAHPAPATALPLSPAAQSWLGVALRQPLGQIAGAPPEDAVTWLRRLREGFTEREAKSFRLLRRLTDR